MIRHDINADRRSWFVIGFLSGLALTAAVISVPLPASWLVPCWILMAICLDDSWPRTYLISATVALLAALLLPPLLSNEGWTAETLFEWLPLWLSIAICAAFSNRYRSRQIAARLDASTDDLTGLLTRKAFLARLESRLHDASKDGRLMSLVFVDCDDFKRRNDQADHRTGDRLLALIGKAILGGIRDVDLAGRYGGDEFTILLDNVSEETAVLVIERLRGAVRIATAVEGEPVEMSVGILGIHSGNADPQELLHRADQLMYQSRSFNNNEPATARYP